MGLRIADGKHIAVLAGLQLQDLTADLTDALGLVAGRGVLISGVEPGSPADESGIERGLVIYKIYMGYWFFGRPTMEELRQDLRAVTRKCRPDWDITTPEFRAAWQQDRKEKDQEPGSGISQMLWGEGAPEYVKQIRGLRGVLKATDFDLTLFNDEARRR